MIDFPAAMPAVHSTHEVRLVYVCDITNSKFILAGNPVDRRILATRAPSSRSLQGMRTVLCIVSLLVSSFWIHAEAPVKRLRFFNLDLHISVIADVRHIFEQQGHEVVDWSISGHTWVFGKERAVVDVVNQNTWMNLSPEMCDQFYERYKDFLNQFDGFIVTHTPAFALLFEKCHKPIIIVNSTRYEQPFTQSPEKWKWLNSYLKKGVESKNIFIISNNKGDQKYLQQQAGIESEHIPSLCLYTRATYTGSRDGFVFKCPFMDVIKRGIYDQSLIQNDKLGHPYRWQDLYAFKGIVHFPYNISTMSIFEEYSANVPLFFPSKKFLHTLQAIYPDRILNQLSFFQVNALKPPTTPQDLNNTNDRKTLNCWVDLADFYDEENMPYIQYFDSFDHLEELLKTVDCKDISQKMKEHNTQRKLFVIEKWKNILSQIEPLRAESQGRSTEAAPRCALKPVRAIFGCADPFLGLFD
jgi:hypothetical protein